MDRANQLRRAFPQDLGLLPWVNIPVPFRETLLRGSRKSAAQRFVPGFGVCFLRSKCWIPLEKGSSMDRANQPRSAELGSFRILQRECMDL